MNGQQRSNNPQKDYSQINIVKQVQKFKNHRGYKLILYIRPFWDTHFGYLDDTFFGLKINSISNVYRQKFMLMEPLEAIDHYLDNIPEIFRNPSLEYDMFANKDLYKPSINALNFVKDSGKKK